MTPEMARNLVIRMARIIERYDPWGYQDIIGDYGDSEETMFDDLVGRLMTSPAEIISGLLDTTEQILEDLEERY